MSESESKTEKKFNLAALRMKPEADHGLAVKQIIQKIPVKKPGKQEFISVCPNEAYSVTVGLLELKDEKQFYLVAPELHGQLSDIKPFQLVLGINRQKQLFIWPIRLPDDSGRRDTWGTSGMEAADEARRSWVKIVPNTHAQAYEVYQAQGALSDPAWPEKPFEELVEIAFKGFIIDSEDHFIIKQLRGQI